MRISEILKASLATLRLNARRTFLTMIGIIIGIAAVITIMSLGKGFQKQTVEGLTQDAQGRKSQQFYYNPTGGSVEITDDFQPFSDKNVEDVQAMAGVSEVKTSSDLMASTIYTEMKYRNYSNTLEVELVDSSKHTTLLAGRDLSITDSTNSQRYAVISENIAYEYFGNIENAIHKSLSIENQNYTVVGVYASEMPDFSQMNTGMVISSGMDMKMSYEVQIPLGTYKRYNALNLYNWDITVYFDKGSDMKTISEQIKTYLSDNGGEKDSGEYTFYDMSESMDEIGKTLDTITYFITAIAAISLFIAGVGVMNMMYISVSERTKEIGIRRSLGATRISIQWQFLIEGIAITTLGGIIGYLTGMGLAFFISRFLPFNALVDVQTALVSVMVSVIIGIVFSFFPARQAARKNVVEILR